jgi:putative nucleotidyltransferase with HDIG domain
MALRELVEEILLNLNRYNVQECLQDIGNNIIAFLKADTCLFFLYNQNQNELFIAKAVGRPALRDERIRMPLGKGIAGYVARTRKPLFFSDIRQDAAEYELLGANDPKCLPEKDGDCRAVIAFPLIAFGNLIGVLEVINSSPRSFSETDMQMLAPLVNIAALAIPRTISDSGLAKLAEICVRFLEEKDQYTHGHSVRVMRYSMLLADELELPDETKEELRVCALLHDIGKVILKDSILAKRGALSRAEFDTVKMHPSIGSNIAGKISKSLAMNILSHHEKFDGTGYPGALSGRKIPLISRIISIADTFDAITSTRPYREQGSAEFAVNEIHRWSGIQFDPILVSAWRRVFGEGRLKVEQI